MNITSIMQRRSCPKDQSSRLIIMKDNAEVFKSMADEMADTIVEHNAKGEKTVFICPVGPVGQYP